MGELDFNLNPTRLKKTGKCDYEKNTGRKCGFDHLDEAKFEELSKKLASE